jgi:hypothetical protein
LIHLSECIGHGGAQWVDSRAKGPKRSQSPQQSPKIKKWSEMVRKSKKKVLKSFENYRKSVKKSPKFYGIV